MAITTWHMVKEDGTTVDITTKLEMNHAISKMGDAEVYQLRPVSAATYETLDTIAYEQGVGLDEALELVIQWGMWWRNSDGNRRCIKVIEYPDLTREYDLEEFIKAQTTDADGYGIMPEDGGMRGEEVDALRNLEIGQSMTIGDREAGLTATRLPNS